MSAETGTASGKSASRDAAAPPLDLDPRRALLAAPMKPRKRTPREALPTALHLVSDTYRPTNTEPRGCA